MHFPSALLLYTTKISLLSALSLKFYVCKIFSAKVALPSHLPRHSSSCNLQNFSISIVCCVCMIHFAEMCPLTKLFFSLSYSRKSWGGPWEIVRSNHFHHFFPCRLESWALVVIWNRAEGLWKLIVLVKGKWCSRILGVAEGIPEINQYYIFTKRWSQKS